MVDDTIARVFVLRCFSNRYKLKTDGAELQKTSTLWAIKVNPIIFSITLPNVANIVNSFTAAFSDELQKKLE